MGVLGPGDLFIITLIVFMKLKRKDGGREPSADSIVPTTSTWFACVIGLTSRGGGGTQTQCLILLIPDFPKEGIRW